MFGKKYEVEFLFDNKTSEFDVGDIATGTVVIRPLAEIEVQEVMINLVSETKKKGLKKETSNTFGAGESIRDLFEQSRHPVETTWAPNQPQTIPFSIQLPRRKTTYRGENLEVEWLIEVVLIRKRSIGLFNDASETFKRGVTISPGHLRQVGLDQVRVNYVGMDKFFDPANTSIGDLIGSGEWQSLKSPLNQTERQFLFSLIGLILFASLAFSFRFLYLLPLIPLIFVGIWLWNQFVTAGSDKISESFEEFSITIPEVWDLSGPISLTTTVAPTKKPIQIRSAEATIQVAEIVNTNTHSGSVGSSSVHRLIWKKEAMVQVDEQVFGGNHNEIGFTFRPGEAQYVPNSIRVDPHQVVWEVDVRLNTDSGQPHLTGRLNVQSISLEDRDKIQMQKKSASA